MAKAADFEYSSTKPSSGSMNKPPFMNKKGDEELVKAIRAGGREEHEALIYINNHQEFARSVKSFILKAGGQNADVQAVFNEGLLAVFNKIKTLPEEQLSNFSVFGYFYRACQYNWYQNRASQQRSRSFLRQLADWFNRSSGKKESLPGLYHSEQLQIVEKIIDELGEPCRSLLLMKEMGASFAEIAEVLGISSEVNARVGRHRCKSKLLERLNEIMPDDFGL